MRIWRGLDERPFQPRPSAAAVGNFDGLHLGHQKILRRLVEKAGQHGLYSVVLTFSPHPERVLGRGRMAMIQTLPQRLGGIQAHGINGTLVVPFNRAFSLLSTEEFIKEIIIRTLGAKVVVVGENFRFGRNREGDIRDLQRLGQKLGFSVYPVSPVTRGGEVVSSSRIRSLLGDRKIIRANALLGRPYEIEGRVIRGAARGRALGIPTANLETANEIVPEGVFVTTTELGGGVYSSLTNIGVRPTFGERRRQIESLLFDFDGNIYRRKIKLRFLKKVRDEKKFDSSPALVSQIRKDIDRARNFFDKSSQKRTPVSRLGD
jgi:riboflavin kinase/FMN adenylyltransferase